MLNNTKIRVSFSLDEIIQIAYKKLTAQNLAPYTHPNVPIDYHCSYNVKNAEGKIVPNTGEITVNFGLIPNTPEPEPVPEPEPEPYQLGDWKDPEVNKIINEEEAE